MYKKNIILFLFFLILFFIFSNYIILKDVVCPAGKDMLVHLRNSIWIIRNFNLIKFFNNPVLVYHNIIMRDQDYPPLYYIISALIRRLFSVELMFMTSTLFLILLIYSTYKIGAAIKDEMAGLLSAVIVSFYPIIYLNSRHFNLELAQAAMVCLSLYLLMRSENFKHRKYSILFGIAFGLSALIKQQVLIFIIGPFFFIVISLFKNQDKKRDKLINLIAAILIFSSISFIFFYHTYLNPVRLKSLVIRTNMTSELDINSGNWFNTKHFLFYLNSLQKYQIGLFNLILFLFSVIILYMKKEYREHQLFFISWILFPLFSLTFIPAKYHEYTISYLPVFALITVLGTLSIRHLFIKINLIAIVLLFNIFLFFNLTFPEHFSYLSPLKGYNNFLDNFKIYYTPIVCYGPFNSKASHQVYRAAEFLIEWLPNKASKIGILSYLDWSNMLHPNELLLLLYTPYEVKDIISDFPNQELDAFDIIIFLSPFGSDEQWLNKDYFIKRLLYFNKQQLSHIEQNKKFRFAHNFFPLYFLYNDNHSIPPNTIPISQKQLEQTINYYSKVKLINKIDGNASVDNIFIYRKL